ncbi:MAG: hypothetical protein QXJ28_00610 [Candidatus Pacearchaeota archaeon]
MKSKLFLVSLTAILMVAMLSAFASAATLDISSPYVQIDGLPATGAVAVVAGDTVLLTVDFTANENASDVTVSAWFQGYRNNRVEKEFADLVAGSDYRARLSIKVPSDLEPEETITLYVRIESDSGNWEDSYTLRGQRQANNLDVLLVDMDRTASAGSSLGIGVVVKNMGRHVSEDTFVRVRIPELGVEKVSYFEDLYPVDSCKSDECQRYDSLERKIFVTIPSNAKEGIYRVEVTAFNGKTQTSVVKNLEVTTSKTEGKVMANPASKNFAVGEQAVYELILVNPSDKIAIYNLVAESSEPLTVLLSDSVAVVPAGSSKVVKVYVTSNKEGTFSFSVSAISDNFSTKTNYVAAVSGKELTSSSNMVILTIILAIIFVVLVVILIVLLTKKPQKSEEFGESYY